MTHRSPEAVHPRGEILRHVVEVADSRPDGTVPLDLPGVTDVFGDELGLVAALQLRWHTRLAGRMERELAEEPSDPEVAVLRARVATAAELPGIRAIIDRCTEQPTSPQMDQALTIARHKEWILLAVMAGRGAATKDATLRAGHRLEDLARALAA